MPSRCDSSGSACLTPDQTPGHPTSESVAESPRDAIAGRHARSAAQQPGDASVLATWRRVRSESKRSKGHSRGNRVHSRKSRSSRARSRAAGLAMVQRGVVCRKPRRPAGPRCGIQPSFFPVKEHADPLLRSVTACHPAAYAGAAAQIATFSSKMSRQRGVL